MTVSRHIRPARPIALVVALALALVALPRAAAEAGDPADGLVSLDPALTTLSGGLVRTAIVAFDHDPTSADLSALSGRGLLAGDPFQALPFTLVNGTVATIAGLVDLAGVRSVWLGGPARPLLDKSVPYTGATTAYTLDCGGVPCDGAGVGIAVIDTGVDGTHPDLCVDGAVLTPPLASDHYCPGDDPVMAQNVYVANNDPTMPVVVEGVANTDLTGGHGTHVAGIAVGSGRASGGLYRGVAPGADLIGISAGEAILIENALVGYDWAITNRATYNIRVINNSWGPNAEDPYDADHPVNIATDAASAHGITVIFAAGNSGPGTETMNTYSVHPTALSVAAGDNRPATVEEIAAGQIITRDPIDAPTSFSSAGIPGHPILHPDLMAPGQVVLAARASTGFAGASDSFLDPVYLTPEHLPSYTTHSGTSMAAPHVAGVAALTWQAALSVAPDTSAETVREVLLGTARQFQPGTVWQEYRAGRGYVDAAAAVTEALGGLAGYTDGVDDSSVPAVITDVASFGGSVVAFIGGTCPSTVPAASTTIPRTTFTVHPGALTLDVMLDWEVVAQDLELCVWRPDGSAAPATVRVRSSEAGVPTAPLERLHLSCSAGACQTGTWTVEVRGSAVAPEAYSGYSSVVYDSSTTTPAGPVTVALSPATGTRTTGESHAITATATDGLGRAVAGAAVDWGLSGVGSFVSHDDVTDGTGRATATLSSGDPGTSTVTATVGDGSAQATVTWDAPPSQTASIGRTWGSGKLLAGEHLTLNVRRTSPATPATGHVTYRTGTSRFEAELVVDATFDAGAAHVTVEGAWNGQPGYTAEVAVVDGTSDSFSITVSSGGATVHSRSGTVTAGQLKVG